jgi:vitamin B12 transporter
MHNLSFRRCALTQLALACFSLLAGHAHAQSSKPETVIVTANRVAQPASEVLIDHEVITSSEIAASGHSSLPELLQRKRGFEISSNGGPTNYTSVFMRGAANAQTLVLVDGVRIGSSTNGGPTWSSIPLSQIDHIEIVYGPLSSMYGADAMGGVVQIFTKPGSTFMEPNLEIGFGSRNVKRIDFGFSGSSGGSHALKFAINASHEEDRGYSSTKPGNFSYNSDKDGYQRDSVSGQLSVLLAKGHEFGTTFMKSRQNTQFDSAPKFDDRDVSGLETWSLYSKNQIMENWQSLLRMANSEDRVSSVASYGNSQFDTKQTTYTWQHDITLGQNMLQLLAEQRDERVAATTKELARSRSTRSYGASYQMKHEQHLGTISLRRDSIRDGEAVTTGNLAYGYRLSKQLRFSSSFGTSFRAPSFNDLYYPGFGIATNRAEKGKNFELGLAYDDGQNSLKAALFRNKIDDLLVYAPVCPNPSPVYVYGCAYNLNRAQITGLSLGANSQLNQQFNLRGSLDWSDPIDSISRKTLPRRAKVHGVLAVEYAQAAYRAGIETVFEGRRFDDVANKNPLAGYGLINLYGSYDLTKNWSLQARWNNITSKDYELAKNYQTAKANLYVALRFTPN